LGLRLCVRLELQADFCIGLYLSQLYHIVVAFVGLEEAMAAVTTDWDGQSLFGVRRAGSWDKTNRTSGKSFLFSRKAGPELQRRIWPARKWQQPPALCQSDIRRKKDHNSFDFMRGLKKCF